MKIKLRKFLLYYSMAYENKANVNDELSSSDAQYIENGAKLVLHENHSNPNKCSVFLNKKMRISRELCLSALSAYCSQDGGKPVECLDAFTASGIAGLQWKHHLKEKVYVTLNDFSPDVYENLKSSLKLNEFSVRTEKDLNSINLPQAEIDENKKTEINISNLDSRILMHQRRFDFIHIDPFGCPVPHLDSAFHNIHGGGGILVITATDVVTLYGKCSHTPLRNYECRIPQATDYVKELAARILIAAVVRAAARCKKGIKILYSAAVEHFIQVGVEVWRGAEAADKCLTQIHEVLLCTECQQTSSIPSTQSLLTGHLNRLLPCECSSEIQDNLSVIGPIWCGSLFTSNFINKMNSSSQGLNLSDQVQQLLSILQEEAEFDEQNSKNIQLPSCEEVISCDNLNRELGSKSKRQKRKSSPRSGVERTCNTGVASKTETELVLSDAMEPCAKLLKGNQNSSGVEKMKNSNDLKTSDDNSRVQCDTSNSDNFAEISINIQDDNERGNKELSTETVDAMLNTPDNQLGQSVPNKECAEVSHPVSNNELLKLSDHGPDSVMKSDGTNLQPAANRHLFYICLHRRLVRGVNLPGVREMISVLRKEGFSASVTHFNPQAVRTSATLNQFMQIINKLSSRNSSVKN